MSLNCSFAGKNVLITGGSRGIGRQLVKRFYEGGANVFTFSKSQANVDKLLTEFPNIVAKAVDISNWNATRTIVQEFGPIDYLVNNAGTVIPQTFMEVTESGAIGQYSVDVMGAINVTQVVAKGMIERGNGGSIVNISSADSNKLFRTISSALACKAAIRNFTKAMAVELGAHNIRVNSVCPGCVKTDTMEELEQIESEDIKLYLERLIVKRRIETDEVADLVIFLLSPLSKMIVGEAVTIDGGWSVL